MKKIIIETPAGTHPKYKLWAKEAAEEMLALFPEYKSSFKAEFSDCQIGRASCRERVYVSV